MVFFKKYRILISGIILFSVWGGIRFFSADKKLQHNRLVVGLQSGYPPFEFVDANGKIVGFDVDIARHIAEKLGKKLIINDIEFEGEILSLKQGKIDLIISGMRITPSRLREILMVPYYGEAVTSFMLLFWKEIPPGIDAIEDIEKLPIPVISVESGTVAETYLQRFQGIQVHSFQGVLAPLMDVKYGKAAAELVESDIGEYLKKKHPEIKTVTIPLSEEGMILGFGIGVKKGNQELFQQVEHIIQELKRSGEMKQIEDRWFK